MVMERLKMEVPRINMTGRHSSLDKAPHSRLSIREVFTVQCKIFLFNFALLQSKFALLVPQIDISGRHSSPVERPVLHSTLHLTGHRTALLIHCSLHLECLVQNSKVLSSFTVRCNALQLYVQGYQTLHNYKWQFFAQFLHCYNPILCSSRFSQLFDLCIFISIIVFISIIIFSSSS